jgi:SAM-dependent methyltransferase
MFFDQFPQFVDNDIRRLRPYGAVTSESLSKRCQAILPVELIKDKRILDIGSALGAMGYYALSNGASSYTGVEIQDSYRNKADKIFKELGQSSYQFVNTLDQVSGTYDIVLACGVIFGFFDIFDFIRRVCQYSNQFVIIENRNPKYSFSNLTTNGPTLYDVPIITFNKKGMAKDNNNNSFDNFSELQTLANKEAVNLLMSAYGFDFDCVITPEPILSSHDMYRESGKNGRYIIRYTKGTSLKTMESVLNQG